MRDSLADDKLITMCLTVPNDPRVPDDHPEIHDVVCIGKILAHHELDDGRFNLLLMGIQRAKIIREIEVDHPYRMADVQLLEDIPVDDALIEAGMRAKLLEIFRHLIQAEKLLEQDSLKSLCIDKLPIGLLIDLMSFSIVIPVEQRQAILATLDVLKRFQKFIILAEDATTVTAASSDIDFPPSFSSN